MKKSILYLFLLFVLSYSCATKSDKKVSVSCTVVGMTCSGCEQSVTAKLQQFDGVKVTKVSHTDSIAEFVYEPSKATKEEITKAVKEAGYEVTAFNENEVK